MLNHSYIASEEEIPYSLDFIVNFDLHNLVVINLITLPFIHSVIVVIVVIVFIIEKVCFNSKLNFDCLKIIRMIFGH